MNDVWLVTGSSSGVGRAIARFLISQNCLVYAPVRDPANKKLIQNPLYKTIKADLSSIEDQFVLVERLKSLGVVFKGLVFSAARLDLKGRRTREGLSEMQSVNFLSAITIAKGIHEKVADDGWIVSIGGSRWVLNNTKFRGDYWMEVGFAGLAQSVVAKFHALKSLGKYTDGRDYKLTAIHPGFVKSNLGKGFRIGFFDLLRVIIMIFASKKCLSFEKWYKLPEGEKVSGRLFSNSGFKVLSLHDSVPSPERLWDWASIERERALRSAVN